MRSQGAVWPLEPGMHVWVDGEHSQRELPPGLTRFQKVTFREYPPDDPTVAVLVDDGGQEYRVLHNQYAGVQLIEVGDEWLPESDPRALDAISDFIERLKFEPNADYSLHSNAAVIEIQDAVLRRNGVL